MKLEEVAFDDVLPFWREQLWPNRTSPIEPASSMLYQGGYDLEIKTRYTPRFFAVVTDVHSFESGWRSQIIGVNSGHQTSETAYRSRGIWVGFDGFDKAMRLHGVGRMLLEAVEQAAREARCSMLWSIPRQSALPFYERCGFRRTSDFFDEGVEFGPNCYSMKVIHNVRKND